MTYPVHGAGLGLRRAHLSALQDQIPASIGFMEVAPENWIDIGGRLGRALTRIAERVPLIAHGLSLDLGGIDPLDESFILRVKQFLNTHHVPLYSEHLSYCADEGHLYELLPVPMSEESAHRIAGRIRRVQEILERRIALENVSYYCAPGQEMEEIDFVRLVLSEADCDLLVDINNIYVNSVNHGYDAVAYLLALPGELIAYAHTAGHAVEAEDLLVDTHGATVIDPVWDLLEVAYAHFGVFPTLLERDQNIPPLSTLIEEVQRIQAIQQRYSASNPVKLVQQGGSAGG